VTAQLGSGRSRLRRFMDLVLALAILLALALLAARLEWAGEQRIAGSARIADGDTLVVGEARLRLAGIDAPELAQICRIDGRDWACGRSAKEALSELVSGRPVDCSGKRRDKYRRLLASCSAGGIDLNRTMVERGWAVAYGAYDAEERMARGEARGLWAGSFDRPRDWRVMHGEADDDLGLLEAVLGWLRELFSGT
jgi:endonuclease YncB( thermonuclease family)